MKNKRKLELRGKAPRDMPSQMDTMPGNDPSQDATLAAICDKKSKELQDIIVIPEAPEILRERARKLQKRFKALANKDSGRLDVCTALLDATHRFKRIAAIYHSGLADDFHDLTEDKIRDTIDITEHWASLPKLKVDTAKRERLAGLFLHSAFQHKLGSPIPRDLDEDAPPLEAHPGEVLLNLKPQARGTAEYIVRYCLKFGIPFNVDFGDRLFARLLVQASSLEGNEALGMYEMQENKNITKHIVLSSISTEETIATLDVDKINARRKGFQAGGLVEYRKKVMAGEVHSISTIIPSEEEANLNGIPYDKFLNLYFELCDQPSGPIHDGQDTLIKKYLNGAKNLRIVTIEDTKEGRKEERVLTMEIKGKRWANTLTLNNIPGSEVNASPTQDKVNGTYVAKGSFQSPIDTTKIIKDITLRFENGKVTDYWASDEKGTAALKELLEIDEGASFIGEVAFGTNSWLETLILNPLLVEKMGGTVHIALGRSYTYEEYDGQPVVVDNGNRSRIHFDITAKPIRVVLEYDDGHTKLLIEDGKFVPPELAILNEGWRAVPQGNIPLEWQERLGMLPKEPPENEGSN